MNNLFCKHISTFLGFVLSFILLNSCTTTKNIPYFQDLKDTSKTYSQVITGSYEIQVQPDDVLGISVNSINPQAAAIFNMVNNTQQLTSSPYTPGTATSTSNSTPSYSETVNGYLVNKQGVINFPVLGDLKVAGLTTSQIKDSLVSKLDKYLQTPIVNVRLLNYKVTVLGEVTHPATYSIPSERITIVDALGMAGDLTIYGKRENILLVREIDGKRNFIRLNLNSSNLFESPYYYLKQNDIIYVEPNKSKIESSDAVRLRNISIITAALTLVVVIVARIR